MWIPGIVYVAPLSLLPKTWLMEGLFLAWNIGSSKKFSDDSSFSQWPLNALSAKKNKFFNNIHKILPIFINYLCLLLIYQAHHIPFRVALYLLTSFPSKNYTFVYNRALITKAKCFIALAVFQPLEFSIPLSTKITTMTIKRTLLTLWVIETMSIMKWGNCSINIICRISWCN